MMYVAMYLPTTSATHDENRLLHISQATPILWRLSYDDNVYCYWSPDFHHSSSPCLLSHNAGHLLTLFKNQVDTQNDSSQTVASTEVESRRW